MEFTRVYRGDELKDLKLDKVSLAKRAVMLRGGFIPATYYGPAFVQTLPVAVGLLDGPFISPDVRGRAAVADGAATAARPTSFRARLVALRGLCYTAHPPRGG